MIYIKSYQFNLGMNKIYLGLVLFAVFALIINSKDSPQKWPKVESPQSQPLKLTEQKQYWFNQVLDHFDNQKTSYWKQRYWVVDDFFNPKIGPIFLYICGQYTCSGVPQQRQWVVTLAQRTYGLIFVVQHRYYGQSLPFGNDSMKIANMIHLTSQQALSDLAFFINQVNVNQMFKVNKNPWITIGGSYPGALSAWFRYKYPHLTIGAIASSAVVTAIQNFQNFDQQIFTSTNKSGSYCYNALNNSNSKVQSILLSANGTQFKRQFTGGQLLSNEEFMFFWIDSFVMQVQYGSRTTFCQALKTKNQNDQFDYLVKLAKAQQVYEYGSYYLKNENFAIQKHSNARAWYYQSCTQFGYWQTPSSLHPMRSKWLGIQFYKKLCSDSYGAGTWPKVNRKNYQYGGFNQKSFNLLMNNGVQDPWIWASIQKSQGNIVARVANCDNCAHCVELYTISTKDAPQLKKIRDEQFLTIQSWIEQYWRNLSKTRGKLPWVQKFQDILQSK